MPNPHPKPAPEPQDDTPKPAPMLPESPEGSSVNPDESAEITEDFYDDTPIPTMFKYSPQGTIAYLNFCFHSDPDILGWIESFRENEKPHMVEHFTEAYRSIVRDVEEAFEVRPDITPQQLGQRVADLTCWVSSPCSKVGAEARFSEIGEDRRFAWEAAHVLVLNRIGRSVYAPGEGDHLFTDPAEDIELPAPTAPHDGHEGLAGALTLAIRAFAQASNTLPDLTSEAAMADVVQPYIQTYARTLASLAELCHQRPDVTPEDLVRVMETRCEMPGESLAATARRIEPESNACAWQFGEKLARRDALDLLTTLLPPAPPTQARAPRMAQAPEDFLRALEEGLSTAPEVRSLLTDMYDDESLRHMEQPFKTAYTLAIGDLREILHEEPGISPDRLFRRLWSCQQAFTSSLLAEDREIALCAHRIEQSYAMVHGYQAAMTVLTRLVPIDRL